MGEQAPCCDFYDNNRVIWKLLNQKYIKAHWQAYTLQGKSSFLPLGHKLKAKCWLSLMLIMNNEYTRVHMAYMQTWMCVSARLQFHTELSCFSWDVVFSLPWLANEPLTLSYSFEERNIVDDFLPFLWPHHSPPHSPSIFLSPLNHLEHSALKIFQVARLLHANILCPTLEDEHKIPAWNQPNLFLCAL